MSWLARWTLIGSLFTLACGGSKPSPSMETASPSPVPSASNRVPKSVSPSPPALETSSPSQPPVVDGAPRWWAVTSDGSRLVTELGSSFVVRDTKRFSEVAKVESRLGPVVSERVFSQRTSQLAWVDRHREINLWNVSAPSKPQIIDIGRRLESHHRLAWSEDGSLLAACDTVGLVLYDVARQAVRFSVARPRLNLDPRVVPEQRPGVPGYLKFSSDGSNVAVDYSYLGTFLYATDSGNPRRQRERRWLVWVPPEPRERMLFWQPKRGGELVEASAKSKRWLTTIVACRGDGKLVFDALGRFGACGVEGPTAQVFDLERDRVLARVTLQNEEPYLSHYRNMPDITEHPRAEVLGLTSDGRGVLVALQHDHTPPEADPHVRLIDVSSGQVHTDLGRSVVLGRAADGRLWVLSLGSQELIGISDALRLERFRLNSPVGNVPRSEGSQASIVKLTATFSFAGSQLVFADAQQPYLVDLARGTVTTLSGLTLAPIKNSPLPATMYLRFSYSPDGTLLLALTLPGHEAGIWDVSSGQLRYRAAGGAEVAASSDSPNAR